MSTPASGAAPGPASGSGAAGAPGGAGRRGRSRADLPSLVLAAVLLVLGVVLAVDASTIEAPRGSGVVGPAAFPWAVAVLLLALGVALGLVATRGRPDEELASTHHLLDEDLDEQLRAAARGEQDDAEAVVPAVPVGEERPPVLRTGRLGRVAVFAAGLLAHALLISTAGYVVAALVLFVAVALAFGAPRLGRVLVGGLVLTLVVFYSFTLGLGLSLPNLGGR
ncbi:tripartite tricarboxylate transporter TctB family protein [Quadrisphaera sp. DSM 44207]|uniref:tripartite tricarboxylate transporter TctB family protein n=1 Tax=Quadrisphaera sp. DSM 44207 TaxID=1881057 RepID=UPI00088B1F4E|nr:tripartite tricarboxylate transporter TctB family protein [Quadrisphaera sp. DSM 44207]SDQ18831.1 putative tricarboxylic transport membrane protein [Quadrisphaera sp. DSM 44207]